jgi:ABC-type lipoprotein export system ATPase subunit
MISLSQVTKTYSTGKEAAITAVHGIDLEVGRGECLVITGRSGAGKTTLLNLVAGLTRPTAGRVSWNSTDLWSMPDRQRSLWRNRTIGFVFQFPSLLPSLNVLENVVLPTTFGSNRREPDVTERADKLLRTVGLSGRSAAYPRHLSAGEQQRVVIARSLISQPEVLLADEPTSDLDEQTEKEIMDLFQEVHATTGITILMVTHATRFVTYGTRAIKMAGGIIDTNEAIRSQLPIAHKVIAEDTRWT